MIKSIMPATNSQPEKRKRQQIYQSPLQKLKQEQKTFQEIFQKAIDRQKKI